jgi:hypothetical protein
MLERRTILAAAILFLAAIMPARAGDAPTANDTARFLAGLPPAAESPLARLASEGWWRQHAQSFDGAFERVEHRQLARIRAWSGKHLGAARPTIFYMFSGPDFLYVNAFFPDAKTYVLAAREPVGKVPDLTTMRGALPSELARLRYSLSTIISYSFFITQHMKSDLHRGQINGTLPILYVFLARSGKTIREVTPVRLDDDAAVQPDTEPVRGKAARGVRIIFAGADGEARTLYYFSTDLADDEVKSSNFLKFCETLGPGNSFIKSDSYLLHSGAFTTVRSFLLANSAVMVQDDSGIPLRYFNRKEWELQPYGHYLGPIGAFPGKYQPDLALLFRTAPPMDFGIGYRWQPQQSNLLLAIKKPGEPVPEARSEPAQGELRLRR